METSEIEDLIASRVDGVTYVDVTTRADHPEDDHYRAVVVAETFVGESLVAQHQRVHDALDGVLTEEVHAVELNTYIPSEHNPDE